MLMFSVLAGPDVLTFLVRVVDSVARCRFTPPPSARHSVLTGYPPFKRGSRRSRRASPNMLKPNTARDSAVAGQIASHGARYMWSSPPSESIPPHVGYGGGTPRPRNERLASVRMTVESPVVVTTMMVGTTFGRTRT